MTRVFQRDQDLLIFVWHHRMCTTATLIKKFYPGTCVNVAYKRIRMLGKDGYLQRVCDASGDKTFWAITPKGSRVIRNHLGAPSNIVSGPSSALHQYLASIVLLGPQLLDPKPFGEIVTESVLKYIHKEDWPQWISQEDSHRSDGYFGISYQSKTLPIAVEIELNRKANKELIRAIDFYNAETKIVRVLWVVESAPVARSMAQYIAGRARADRQIHNFVVIRDIEKSLWDAVILHGPEAKSNVETLFRFGSRKSVEIYSKQLASNCLLDCTRTATSLIAYQKAQKLLSATKGVGTPMHIEVAPNILPVSTDSPKGLL
jgi:hypothetical protein